MTEMTEADWNALIERMKIPQEPQPWIVSYDEWKRMIEALEPGRKRFTG